ncbi:hypothetical protein BJX63DRAFT_441347 [Aspergillus granulosus]|uniref:WSC domain-containing protein n=1 Tax=Aspergillus granulosus TaxID=176169 RepID=A0ABR4GSZ2_9EURO
MALHGVVTLLCGLGFLATSSASPLRAPLSVPDHVRRATNSEDPSCPDGFFCKQSSCPEGVVCPSGETCINFEGNFACAPPGLQWCALNPTTLQGVGCDSGLCWSENVLLSSTTHLTNYIQCSIGAVCNVCNPGQTCGDNQCVGGSNPSSSSSSTTTTTSSTTSSTTTTIPPVITTSSTTTTSTTTTRSSTTTTTSQTTTTTTTTTSGQSTSTSSSTTTTTSASSAPTQPARVGTFSLIGCYSDQVDPRVLVADSSEDSTGMTVEACVSLAKAGSWRYAGVEYSSQCFVGNQLHGGTLFASSDCNMPCSGNPGETCGGGNRIQIYSDATWEDPTYGELTDAVHQYNASVWQALQVIEDYRGHLETLQGILQSGQSTKVKREGEYEEIELSLLGDQSAANEASTSLAAAKENGNRVLTLGRRLDTIEENNPRVPQYAFDDWDHAVTNTVNSLEDQLLDVIRDLNANVAELSNAISSGITPAIDAAASIARVDITINAIGLPVSAGVTASGIFLVLATLAALFESNGSPITTTAMPSTTTTVSSTTTSSSSTSCAASATTSPVIILTVEGTTVEEFEAFVATLPKDPEALQFTESWQPNFIYMGIVDQCSAEQFNSNPIIDAWNVDGLMELDSNDDTLTSDTSTTKRSYRHKAEDLGDWGNPNEEPTNRNTTAHHQLQRRYEPTPDSRFQLQQNSPNHLKWLSQVSRYTNLDGDYLSFDDVIYNDPPASSTNPKDAPIVYLIDSAFLTGHESFTGSIVGGFGVDDVGGKITGLTFVPRNDHGTCMASLAVGKYHSMGKKARLVPVELVISKSGVILELRARRAAFVFKEIYRHIIDNGGKQNAVISMSFGAPRDAFEWGSGLVPSLQPKRDIFDRFLSWFYNLGVSVVCSAGNDQRHQRPAEQLDLSYFLPRGKGGADTPLIVVGNSFYNNSRHPDSQYGDSGDLGILTLYNVGTDVDCATIQYTTGDHPIPIIDAVSSYRIQPAGTSQATAITAGMIAYYLSQPDLKARFMANGPDQMPKSIKSYLRTIAVRYKGAPVDGIPRAASGDVIPCVEGTAGRPPIVDLELNLPTSADPRTFATTQVTDGEAIVISPIPQCWNLQ